MEHITLPRPFQSGDLIVHGDMPYLGLYEFVGTVDSRLIVGKIFGDHSGRVVQLFKKMYRLADEEETAYYVTHRMEGANIWLVPDGPVSPKELKESFYSLPPRMTILSL